MARFLSLPITAPACGDRWSLPVTFQHCDQIDEVELQDIRSIWAHGFGGCVCFGLMMRQHTIILTGTCRKQSCILHKPRGKAGLRKGQSHPVPCESPCPNIFQEAPPPRGITLYTKPLTNGPYIHFITCYRKYI